MRLAVPAVFGMHCAGPVCVEDAKDKAVANQLYGKALSHINGNVKQLETNPRFTFCRTRSCYKRFGGGEERAMTYPYLGTIIASESWQSHIVKHEMVHWLQFQEYGAIGTMSKPVRFREGMAYALSGAPSSDIPTAHMPFVRQYDAWQKGRSMREIWHDDTSELR
jgi:hypothetical protein